MKAWSDASGNNINTSYKTISPEMLIADEEIYLSDYEYQLNKKTLPIALMKKATNLAFSDSKIIESDVFYEIKYL